MPQITPEEKKALKGRGYILSRDGAHFVARVITEDGVLTAQQMEVLAEAARRFGSGSVALTVRMTVEVQGIPYENIQPFEDFLAEAGLYCGGTGARVRPIVACKGSVCVHGLYDTQALARELHQRFYLGWHQVRLPHKFKIGLGGCPNNCIKPGLNDFGVIGQRVPLCDAQQCRGCKKCAAVCPVKAAVVENGTVQIDRTRCTGCGKCIAACPFGGVREEKSGYRIVVGGYWGKRQRLGTVVDGVYSREELLEMIERSLLLYCEQGKDGERFGMFIDRIGVESFVAQLKSGEVMRRREQILADRS